MKFLFIGFIFWALLIGCGDKESTSPDTKKENPPRLELKENGYFAFTGSYSPSSLLPLVEFLQNNLESSLEPPPIIQQIKHAEAVADLIKKERVESIFTTGDNNYSYGCHSTIDLNIGRLYHPYIGNYQGKYGKGANVNQFFPALGNHDVLVYEAYLIKNDLPITLGLYGIDNIYRFSKDNWILRLSSSAGSKEFSRTLIQYLIDQNKMVAKNVALENNTTGIAYIPSKTITLSDFTQNQQDQIKATISNSFLNNQSVEAKTLDSLTNLVLYDEFNLYCILEDDIGPELPYIKYFTLPGNERYYKVSKEHENTKVDFFILNINSTINSESAHEPDGIAIGSVQHQWFVNEATNSDADFKIVINHNEVWTSFEEGSIPARNWNLEQYADIVLSGDVESYERISIKTAHGNAWFLSVGVGGLALNANKSSTPLESSVKTILEYGALFMQINSTGLNLYFKNTDGQTRDSFQLSK